MKAKPLLLIFLLVTITLCILQVCFGIFTPYNYVTAQWHKHHGTLQLLSYGEQQLTQKQQVVVANEMGFDIKAIAGCFISQSAINGAEQYNKVMNNALTAKLGKSWKAEFDRKVDVLFRQESGARIYEAVLDYGDVRSLIRQADSVKQGSLYIRVINPSDTDISQPNAWLCQDAKVGYYVLRYYRVDPYTLKVGQIIY